jgi:hypothetical protein
LALLDLFGQSVLDGSECAKRLLEIDACGLRSVAAGQFPRCMFGQSDAGLGPRPFDGGQSRFRFLELVEQRSLLPGRKTVDGPATTIEHSARLILSYLAFMGHGSVLAVRLLALHARVAVQLCTERILVVGRHLSKQEFPLRHKGFPWFEGRRKSIIESSR